MRYEDISKNFQQYCQKLLHKLQPNTYRDEVSWEIGNGRSLEYETDRSLINNDNGT